MASLMLRRLAQAALILLGVAAITFVLLYALPADPARMIAGRSATAQTVANIRHELGLDQPLLVQFGTYLGNLLHGNLGRSYAQKTDVWTLIAARLPSPGARSSPTSWPMRAVDPCHQRTPRRRQVAAHGRC